MFFFNQGFKSINIFALKHFDIFTDVGITATTRHSILVETPSSSSSDGFHEEKKLLTDGHKRPKVKIRRKCLRTQSTSELPQLGNGGLKKGMRKVHSSSSCYKMAPIEDSNIKVN